MKNCRDRLLDWISERYESKRIRISGEPYLAHLTFVAVMASQAAHLGYEIGLSHDLYEDFDLDSEQFTEVLLSLDYNNKDAELIAFAVTELTTVFTADKFPLMKKKERRERENQRLTEISAEAQTVKYADLIYNAEWTIRYEPQKAQAYLTRKLTLLQQLNKGDPALRSRAIMTFKAHLKIT